MLCFAFGSKSLSSQNDIDFIADSYEDYINLPREVVYLHLNKSTVFVGETLGFTAYVLNKSDKKPSSLTKNLYVTIEDKNQNVVKQKMIMVDNGTASNIFEIDSLFSNQTYTIKAYTNWLRNFNENNFFNQSFKVETIETLESSKSDAPIAKIDAQFLPESGHLLHGVENTIGVIIKDQKGRGLALVKGNVVDKNGTIITTFSTNPYGIGRFPLNADYTNDYTINIDYNNKVLQYKFNQDIKRQGVILSVKQFKEKLMVSAITNSETLGTIKNQRYTLLLHNGDNYDLMDIYFTDEPKVTKVIELDGSPGINILTLFNENNKPVAERLVFNYKGINIIESKSEPIIKEDKDSLTIALDFETISTSNPNNISISILPKETLSYLKSHNIVSYNYLYPYLREPIENAQYYFKNITNKKKYELDNLLLTQGWSSYNWNSIFNNSPDINYDFEQGIILKANYTSNTSSDSSKPNDLMYYFGDEGFLIAEGDTENNSYIIKNLFPEEDQTIKLSEITPTKGLKPANLYAQFFPREIPYLRSESVREVWPDVQLKPSKTYTSNTVFETTPKIQKLEEVTVKSNPALQKRERQNELSRGRFGRVSVISEEDEKQFFSLWNYLSFKAWLVLDPRIYGPNGPRNNVGTDSLGMQSPSSVNFYLNDVLLADLAILDPILIEDVDFIEVNRFGLNEGMRSPRGSVKIYTKDPLRAKPPKNVTRTYDFPLTFNEKKKFYTPKYKYYQDDFFKHYGVIDWKPNLSATTDGKVTFKIEKPDVPITLFIEGIANDGSFIVDEKSISSN